MRITVPDFCLVAVLAPAAEDAAAVSSRHFADCEPVSLARRDWPAAVANRLAGRQLAVAHGAEAGARDLAALVRLAKQYYCRPVAIMLHAGGTAQQRRAGPRRLEAFGFREVHALPHTAAATLEIGRMALACDLRHVAGPFDIIGDVHGCAGELILLLERLGYGVRLGGEGDRRQAMVEVPAGRRPVFIGDFVDRGPRSPDALRIAMAAARSGGLAVPGNHDAKFVRWLRGSRVSATHGLDRTIAQFAQEPAGFRVEVRRYLEALPAHLWCEGGQLAIVHAGIRQEMLGREGGAVRSFCLYGDTGEGLDEWGLPVRFHWAAEYRGATAIVYGHTPVPAAEWVNNTICIDTGCCFGGSLTALRWPERELVSVPAARAYAERTRPFGHPPPRPATAHAVLTKE